MAMMRIFVTDLAEYNERGLNGEWLDLDDFMTAEELQDYVETDIVQPGNEEWFISDAENDFGYRVDEYESFDHLFLVKECAEQIIDQYGEDAAMAIFLSGDCDFDSTTQEFYVMSGESESDIAYDYIREYLGVSEEALEQVKYIDYAACYRDLRMGCAEVYHNGTLYLVEAC